MAFPTSVNNQITDSAVVTCDGSNGGANPALGHPRVTLTVGDGREVVCPYCSLRFTLAEGAKAGHGH